MSQGAAEGLWGAKTLIAGGSGRQYHRSHVPIDCLFASARPPSASPLLEPELQGSGDRRSPAPAENPAPSGRSTRSATDRSGPTRRGQPFPAQGTLGQLLRHAADLAPLASWTGQAEMDIQEGEAAARKATGKSHNH
jgi:hypothetical protein